jgi:hypothetical protein
MRSRSLGSEDDLFHVHYHSREPSERATLTTGLDDEADEARRERAARAVRVRERNMTGNGGMCLSE